jgi:hypothetical protein
MSTDTQDVKLEVKPDLEGKINHLAMEVSLLREQIRTQVNSRRGLEGARGERGETGQPGRDAVIKIVQADGKVQVIEGDKVAAEIVAVAGPKGDTGATGSIGATGAIGPQGPAPDVNRIVSEVVKVIETRLLRK